MSLWRVKTREEAVGILDGHSLDQVEALQSRQQRKPLIKSYLLELGGPGDSQAPLLETFKRSKVDIRQIDDSFYVASTTSAKETFYYGFIEQLSNRFCAIYSTQKAAQIEPRVMKLVKRNRHLDHLWFSGRAFKSLWDSVSRDAEPLRFGKIQFRHSNRFEDLAELEQSLADPVDSGDSDESGLFEGDEDEVDADQLQPERRDTKFTIVERIGVLKEKLGDLLQAYEPLNAISQLRLPDEVRGGHDLYHNGKVTNRSDSFRRHRHWLMEIVRLYGESLRKTEQAIWFGVQKPERAPASIGESISGAPVVLTFSKPLSEKTFRNFITATFVRKNSRLDLWGNPIELGNTKVHVYALDRHLWKPLFLEITERKIVVIVPEGTCGNTIHRLVTNVQRDLDPSIDVTIGDQPYTSFFTFK